MYIKILGEDRFLCPAFTERQNGLYTNIRDVINHVSEATFYVWLKRFREEEPELFGQSTPVKGWIEVAKQNKKDSVALAVAPASDLSAPTPAIATAALSTSVPTEEVVATCAVTKRITAPATSPSQTKQETQHQASTTQEKPEPITVTLHGATITIPAGTTVTTIKAIIQAVIAK